jgi:hypothetical protein
MLDDAGDSVISGRVLRRFRQRDDVVSFAVR